jgi:phage/plasmid-like protein (TIGR03299 family)
MAHNFTEGFMVREPAWHGLGNVVDTPPTTWAEIRNLAGLEWEPVEGPVFVRTRETPDGMGADGQPFYNADAYIEPMAEPTLLADGETDEDSRVPRYKGIFRSDTRELLDIADGSYSLITHKEMGEIAESILGQAGVVGETGGMLGGGKKVWVLLNLGEGFTIPGDTSQTFPYLALLNAHDGTSPFRAIPTAVRVVCQNTFNLASMSAGKAELGFSIRHTIKWAQRAEEASAIIKGSKVHMEQYQELATDLSGIRITDKQRKHFIQEILPSPRDKGEICSDRVHENVETSRGKLVDIFDSPTTEPIRHTAYGLVQGFGEYLDHIRDYKTKETLLNRNLLTIQKGKAKAIELARTVAKDD